MSSSQYDAIPDLEDGQSGGLIPPPTEANGGLLYVIHAKITYGLDRVDEGNAVVNGFIDGSTVKVITTPLFNAASAVGRSIRSVAEGENVRNLMTTVERGLSRIGSTSRSMLSGQYKAIPDVGSDDPEEGGGKGNEETSDVAAPPALVEDLYPEANEQERKLLETLDEIVEKATPDIALPRIEAEDLGPPLSFGDFAGSLKVLTTALVVTVVSALVVIGSNSAVMAALFPYYACFLTFVASIPATRDRFMKQVGAVLAQIQDTKEMISEMVQGVSDKGIGFVHSVEDNLNKVLEPMRSEIDKVTKLEKALQKIDPSIDIPDVSDLEKKLDDAEDSIVSIFDTVNWAIDLNRYFPKPLRSSVHFDMYIFFPTLLVFLILQLVATGAATGKTAAVAGSWKPISTSFQTYFAMVLQLGISFLATNTVFLARRINTVIESIEKDIRNILDSKVGPVFKDILVDRMKDIKEHMLGLIRKMEKIEGPMKKLNSMKMPKSLKQLKVKVPKVEVPIVEMPQVEVPKMDVPSVPSFKGF